MRLNPEELAGDQAFIMNEPAEKKPFVSQAPAASSTTVAGGQIGELLPIVSDQEERPDIVHGVGSLKEFNTRLTQEDEPVPYVYQARLTGKRVKEAMHYPRLPFDYSIEKVGTRLVDERSVGYSLRVDAHPKKVIKGQLTHELKTDKEQTFEADLEINTTAPRNEYRSRIRWDGVKEVMTHSDVKDIFVSSSTVHVTGKGKTATWQKRDGQVIDVKNASWFSGVISGSHIKKSHYEAEFEFTPTYTTDQKYTVVRRVTNGYKVVKPSGHSKKKYWDDDIVGMIFKAKSKSDFYVLLWESDERLGRSSRIGDISGRHVTDEQLFLRDTIVSPVGPGMTSVSKKKWDDYTKHKGWGENHAKVYRVVNGVFHKVSLSDKRKENAGWTFGVRQGMRVVSQGKRVKLYLKNTSTGGWHLAFEFDSAYEEGSFGMCNISQAVLFHKVRYIENQKISGVIPQEGWHRTKKPSVALTSNTLSFVTPYAKRAAGGKKCEVLHVKAEEDPKTAKFGSVAVKFPSGGITITTKNPDNSKLLTYKFTQTGSFIVTPDNNTPSRSITAFDGALNLFKTQLDNWKKSHPDQKIMDYDFDLIEPTMKDDDDWDLIGADNEKLVFWNSNLKEQKVDIEIPVYAYEGKVAHPLSEWFSVNSYSSASFDVDESTFDRWHDEWSLSGAGDSLTLNVKTTEWYKGVQAEHLRLYGTVSSKEPLFLPMPAMPEHYIHPIEEGPMYHGHESVNYTLLQLSPTDGTAFASFNLAGDATTERSNAVNATTGQPLVVTNTQLDTLYVKAKPDPRLVAWRSGSKTGSTSVNGVRPFLSEARGQQSISIGTTELKEPEDLANLERFDVVTTDPRIRHVVQGKDILFYSDHQSNYRYTSGWQGEWRNDLTPRFARRETSRLHDGLILLPEESPNYDSSVLIEGIEAKASTPFVQLKGQTVEATAKGLVGRYHQKASTLEIVEEVIPLEGEEQRYEQHYTVPGWKAEQQVKLPIGVTVKRVWIEKTLLAPNSYTVSGDTVTITKPILQAGELQVDYVTGMIKRSYPLTKKHMDGLKVYVGSTRLDASDYDITTGRIQLNENIELKSHDVLTIRSIKVARPYSKEDTSLGRYIGARIDDEIWYDWGLDGPFPIQNIVTSQALGYHEATVEAHIAYDEQKQRFVDETKGWRQYDVAPPSDTTNYGQWGGQEEGFEELTTMNNGMFTAKMSPILVGRRIGINSNMLMQGLDNDAAGLILQSADKVTSYVFGWDTNGTSFKGLKLQKWVCQNPLQEGAVALSHIRTTLYENPMLFGEPGEDANTMSGVAEHTMRMILDKKAKTITLQVDGVVLATVNVLDLQGEFSAGVFAESQAETRYRDIVTFEEKLILASEEDALRTTLMTEIEPPISTGASNQFEYTVSPKRMGELFKSAVEAIAKDRRLLTYRTGYSITNRVTTGAIYFDETMNTDTDSTSDQVMVLIEGVAPAMPAPILLPQDTVLPPNIPNEELPTGSLTDAFAVEWSGYLDVKQTGLHLFELVANEGIILEIDGQKIFESFEMTDGKAREARIHLIGGTSVRFRLRYYENRSYAYVRLRMKEPNGVMRRIPKSRFVPYKGYVLEASKSIQYPEPWALQVQAGDLFFGRQERHLYALPKTEQLALDAQLTVTLSETPRLGAPIHVWRGGKDYREVAWVENGQKSLYQLYRYGREGASRVKLPIRTIDAALTTVRRNGIREPFEVEGQSLLLATPIFEGETIEVRFADPLSFYATQTAGKTTLHFAENIGADYGPMVVTYETSEEGWHKTDLTLNPVRTKRDGMAFYEEVPSGEVAHVKLTLSENRIEASEKARVTALVHVTDALGNALEDIDVTISWDARIEVVQTASNGEASLVIDDLTKSVVILARSGDTFDAQPVMKGEAGYRLQLRHQQNKLQAKVETLEGMNVVAPIKLNVIRASSMNEMLYTTPIDLPIGQTIYIGQIGNDMVRVACQRNE